MVLDSWLRLCCLVSEGFQVALEQFWRNKFRLWPTLPPPHLRRGTKMKKCQLNREKKSSTIVIPSNMQKLRIRSNTTPKLVRCRSFALLSFDFWGSFTLTCSTCRQKSKPYTFILLDDRVTTPMSKFKKSNITKVNPTIQCRNPWK